MQDKHQAERENIVKLLTSEREKQMQIQADERKQFALSHRLCTKTIKTKRIF
jgi:hypothetical protein